MDRQALPAVFIDHRQHPERLAVKGAVGGEVVAPDMATILGSEPHARAIVQPQPTTFWLLLRNFEPLATPDALDPLRVYRPAVITQQGGDTAVAVSAVLRGQPDDLGCQQLLIRPRVRRLPLGRTVLARHLAGTTLRYSERRTHMVDRRTAPRGAQYFPSTISFRIKASSVRFDTAFRSRWFSFSRSFNRRAWLTFNPPAIVTLLRYAQRPVYRTNPLALYQPNLGFSEHPDNLLRCISLPCHSKLLSSHK